MQPSEARPTITEAASSPQRASVTNRRQSLPVISGAGLSVSKPTARRPVSFLCVDSAVSSSHDLLSPGKLADLQHALGSRLGSKSSVRVSHSRASIGVEKQESSSPAGGNCKGKSVRTSLVATPATPARSHRRSVITTPNTSTPTSPKNSRRFSFSPGLGHSKIDLLRTAMTPRPPLPQTPREAPHLPESVGRSKDFTAVSPNAVADITHKRKAIGSSRMVKARSMVVEHVHHRKPVPSLDDVGPQRPTRTRSTTGDTKVNTAGPSRLSGLKPPGKVFFGEGREGLSPPFLTEPPVLHRALPITERSLDQHSKKRSRGFSFTSTISKRAQKARSVIVGRSEHHVAQPELHIRRALDRQETVETRGSSLGCADYEPDLVPEAMSFAPRSRTLKSAVSEDQLTADQDILERKEVHSMNSSDLIASPDAAEDFPDPVDLL
ncbi:hypothetical protein BC835DRAFT_703696 [Cytidiella melzeri]|nr:hypothetical protein BC835DRAFT_703696 [Cytidiella melzeri]